MRVRKYLRVGAIVAALSLTLAACGGDDDDGDTTTDTGTEATEAADTGTEMTGTEADTGTAAAAGDLDLITEGTLTVCSDIPYAPFEFEEDGEITGFDIEMMRAIAEEMGLELEINAIGFDPIQSGTALNSDQCDVAASAMTITDEREENLDFTDPYYNAEQSLLVPAGSEITTLDDVSGMTLGVQSATTGEMYARENAPGDAEITAFENPGDLLTALQSNQVDAVLQDLPVNAEFVRNNESFEVIETYDTGEQYGFAVAEEGSDALLQGINAALQGVRDAGTYDELYNQYFGTEPAGTG